MFKLTTTQTAQIPSGFAMPTCGHASVPATGVITGATVLGTSTTGVVVWDRREDSVLDAVVAGKRDAVRTLAYFPGTTAWRPPIC